MKMSKETALKNLSTLTKKAQEFVLEGEDVVVTPNGLVKILMLNNAISFEKRDMRKMLIEDIINCLKVLGVQPEQTVNGVARYSYYNFSKILRGEF